MSILANANIKAVTQDMAGNTGTSHAEQAQSNFTVSVDAVKELLAACRNIDPSLS